MFNPAYLTLSRHHIYYFRFPIPATLHPQGRQTDIKLSLQTRDPQEALYMARSLVYFAENAMNSPIVRLMDYQDIRDILTEHFKAMREQVKARIAKHGQLQEREKQIYSQSHDLAVDALKHEDYAAIGTDEELEKIITAQSLPLEPDTPEYKLFRTEYVKGYRDYCKSVLDYNARFDGYQLATDPASLAMQKAVRQIKRKKLADAIDAYIEEKLRLGKWTPTTADGFRAQLNLMAEYLGADASLHVSSDIANDVKRMLMAIPQRARTNPKFKKMSIPQLMAMKGQKVMGLPTLSKYLQTYSAFYDWAVKRKDTDENNFKDLVEKAPNEQVREDFKPEQIKTMLDEIIHNKHGLINKPYQKWGTLIAMYTGARLNEIAQLELSDIKQVDGVWCFDFNDEGENKRLKNKASRRIVPIHSRLIDMKFLDFVEEVRKSGKARLLHDLSYSVKNGYGRNMSRWFSNRFLTELGIKSDKLVFHSFRHTVTTQLLRNGVEEPVVKKIIGHSLTGPTQTVYAHKAYTVSRLQEAIEKLPY